MNEQIELYCNRTGETLNVPVYDKDGEKILYHRWLEEKFWSMSDELRPELTFEPVDLRNLPGIPPMFAVKCILKKGAVTVEQIGEVLCMEWEKLNEISKKFPLTVCKNMAFDRAFIRYMQFSVKQGEEGAVMYSSSEIAVPNEGAVLTNNVVPMTQPVSEQTQAPEQMPNQEQGMSNNTPPYPWQNQSSVVVTDVTHFGKAEQAYIKTNCGELLYDRASNKFRERNATIQFTPEVLHDVYAQASSMIDMDLAAFAGMVQN